LVLCANLVSIGLGWRFNSSLPICLRQDRVGFVARADVADGERVADAVGHSDDEHLLADLHLVCPASLTD
jgi:hypothetical protein